MTEWIECTLDKLGEIVGGATPSTKCEDYYGGSIPWITPKDLSSFKGRYITSGERNITEKGLASCSAQMMPKDAVLFTSRAPIGYVAIASQSVCTNQGFKSIVVNEKADPLFVYYLLKYNKDAIEAMGSGTTFKEVSGKTMRAVKVRIPLDVSYQKRIAAVLDSLDTKIENNERINDNLLEQMQALYKSWFVDYRPFGGVMPTSWTQTGIYSLANIIYGAPFASKQFNTEGNGRPIIRIRDLKDQQFATYTTEVHPKGYLLHPGDIVVGMDGEFRPYIWGNDEAWLNQRVCVFENKRPNGKAFLYFTIKPLLFAIEQTQVATTVIHIGKKDFDAFEIMLPDTELLDAFDVITTPMVEQIVSNSIENKRLAIMRDALLPKLMSGEINVSNIQL